LRQHAEERTRKKCNTTTNREVSSKKMTQRDFWECSLLAWPLRKDDTKYSRKYYFFSDSKSFPNPTNRPCHFSRSFGRLLSQETCPDILGKCSPSFSEFLILSQFKRPFFWKTFSSDQVCFFLYPVRTPSRNLPRYNHLKFCLF
jgi:hypothetical protein